ncbi:MULTISPECIES: nuclease-related domain-containing protein [unclassified Sporosarcina]|uniref:nuclease-related domain-containing protein n=1 Tax=unclassified Sporosarcina TaxID=2647733 RepID=UPI0020407619|nr:MULTISPECIES: nuclease-related domain-containing protein [unclassified Sporosarcina]GKV65554.1 hypothetical protein NCCP2331_17070 [Sporosarcina sp. NCCP-2331]GLB55679.1 hypothetical protein NCCP2378_14660 [Sporosarcina sp. NCCP-2378]
MELFFDTLRAILFNKAIWFLAFMMILSTIVKIQLPRIRGAAGERIVQRRLNKLGDEYRSYHDLYVEDTQNGLTQIDHIVISKYGVHVIETKNYSGWIFGSELQKYWTQTIYKNKQKFYNPIRQNYGHIEALKSYLNMPSLPVYSIIAFSDEVEFKFKEPFQSAQVIHYRKLVKTIRQDNKLRLTDRQMNNIIRSLDQLDQMPKKDKKAIRKTHLQQVRKKQQVART